MKETGIIMSGNHPRLILDGLKTMTRRTWGLEVVNQNPDAWQFLRMEGDLAVFRLLKKHLGKVVPPRSRAVEIRGEEPYLEFLFRCPYGQVGDRLVIIEAWATENQYNHLKPSEIPQTAHIYYTADGYNPFEMGKVRSARFMCYWMSRAKPDITGLRAERLRDISRDDVLAEGIFPFPYHNIAGFITLWDSLNAKRGYDTSRQYCEFSVDRIQREMPTKKGRQISLSF